MTMDNAEHSDETAPEVRRDRSVPGATHTVGSLNVPPNMRVASATASQSVRRARSSPPPKPRRCSMVQTPEIGAAPLAVIDVLDAAANPGLPP